MSFTEDLRSSNSLRYNSGFLCKPRMEQIIYLFNWRFQKRRARLVTYDSPRMEQVLNCLSGFKISTLFQIGTIVYPSTSFTSRVLREVNVQNNNSRKKKAKETTLLFCVYLFVQSRAPRGVALSAWPVIKQQRQLMGPASVAGYWIEYRTSFYK